MQKYSLLLIFNLVKIVVIIFYQKYLKNTTFYNNDTLMIDSKFYFNLHLKTTHYIKLKY